MEGRQQWVSWLKKALSDSPLASNVVLGLILTVIEKLVELEFACPCDPTWNKVFSSAFFIIPAVTAFFLMLIIQGCRCDAWHRMTVSSFVPAIVWLILMFFDGQYFACAKTDWEGRYVLVDKAAPQKWCEPISEGNVTSQELMRYSQQQFSASQRIGIGIFFVFICAGFGVYVVRKHPQEVERQDADENELREARIE